MIKTGLINWSKEEKLMESLLFIMAEQRLGGFLISVPWFLCMKNYAENDDDQLFLSTSED